MRTCHDQEHGTLNNVGSQIVLWFTSTSFAFITKLNYQICDGATDNTSIAKELQFPFYFRYTTFVRLSFFSVKIYGNMCVDGLVLVSYICCDT